MGNKVFLCLIFVVFIPAAICAEVEASVQVAVFEADVTPPVGAPLCGGAVASAQAVDDPLLAKGIALFPAGQQPIVLCAVDWVGIANDGLTAWKEALAEAAGTVPNRVTVHALHQHDAPVCDFSTRKLLAAHGLEGAMFDADFAREAIRRTASALRDSANSATPVTHIGSGEARVEEVASNRRLLGPDGKVEHMRWTTCRDPELRARPVGVIDPFVKSVSLWNEDNPIAVLTYYATHPQSHYGNGGISCDFPGLARKVRQQAVPEAMHIHFTGAAGNVGAGKWNDGAVENRLFLAGKLAEGMRKAWENTSKTALTANEIAWKTADVLMPPREEVSIENETKTLEDAQADTGARITAAREIAWLQRNAEGDAVTLSRLQIGPTHILHMPGELFVQYQLAAQELRPDGFVCMAAYGDYAPGYIGTEDDYPRGGYETSVHVARVGPGAEAVLMEGIRKLLTQ